MSDIRTVPMSAEQYELIERLIPKLMYESLERESYLLMNLVLGYRFTKPAEPVLPSNVIEFPGYSQKVGA